MAYGRYPYFYGSVLTPRDVGANERRISGHPPRMPVSGFELRPASFKRSRMVVQFVFASIVTFAASVGCWCWFGRAWKRGEIETRTGLCRVDVEPEEYWFTMSVFGALGALLFLMSALSLAFALGFGS